MANQKYDLVTNKGTVEIGNDAKLQVEPATFKALGRIKRVNNMNFSREVREFLQKKFHDLIGVYVSLENGNILTTLFFENNASEIPAGKFKNLKDYTNSKGVGKSMFDKVNYINNKVNGKSFELNDATKLFLGDIMYGGRGNNLPNSKRWKDMVFERRIPAGNIYQPRAERIIIGVKGIDINRLCKLMYGSDMVLETVTSNGQTINTDSHNAFYSCAPIKITPFNGGFVFSISQLDKDEVDKLFAEDNPGIVNPNNGGLTFY